MRRVLWGGRWGENIDGYDFVTTDTPQNQNNRVIIYSDKLNWAVIAEYISKCTQTLYWLQFWEE